MIVRNMLIAPPSATRPVDIRNAFANFESEISFAYDAVVKLTGHKNTIPAAAFDLSLKEIAKVLMMGAIEIIAMIMRIPTMITRLGSGNRTLVLTASCLTSKYPVIGKSIRQEIRNDNQNGAEHRLQQSESCREPVLCVLQTYAIHEGINDVAG